MKIWQFNRFLLGPALQTPYQLISSSMNRREKVVDVSGTGLQSEDLDSVLKAIRNDNPLLYDSRICRYWADQNGYVSEVEIEYSMSNAEYDHIRKRILREVEYCRGELGDYERMSEMERVEAVHDMMISRLVYRETPGSDSDDDHTVVGTMLNRCGVCDGIAHAVNLVLNSIGVKSSVITGDIIGREGHHAWNIVELNNGRRGHLDVGFDVVWRNPYPIYEFFMISDEELAKTRVWDTDTQCEGFESYYDRHSLRVFDEEDFIKVFRREHEHSNSFILKMDAHLKEMDPDRLSILIQMASNWNGPDNTHVYEGGEIRFIFR